MTKLAENDTPWTFDWQEGGLLHVTVDTTKATNPVMECVTRIAWLAPEGASRAPDGDTDALPEFRVVAWIDSSLQNVQVGRSDYPKPELIRSVGFVVAETDEYITLARDDMKDDEFRGLVCIPKECVK